MPEAKRPEPRRRGPASRPGAGPRRSGSGRPASPTRRDPRAAEPRRIEARAGDDGTGEKAAVDAGAVVETGPLAPIRRAIAEQAEHQSEQRLGSAARRAAILAVVVCVLTLTIAGPVRTFFSQRTEMRQLSGAETQLRSQIADLEQQKAKLADPVYIAAQARERLGFVMPGDIPYQVQLPQGPVAEAATPGTGPAAPPAGQPWYTTLWNTIADAPHGVSAVGPAPVPIPGPAGAGPVPPPAPAPPPAAAPGG